MFAKCHQLKEHIGDLFRFLVFGRLALSFLSSSFALFFFFLLYQYFPKVPPESSLVAQTVTRLPTMRETRVQSLGWEDLLQKEMATYSSILTWKIPWRRNLVGYSPWGCKKSDMTEQLHSLTPPASGCVSGFRVVTVTKILTFQSLGQR